MMRKCLSGIGLHAANPCLWRTARCWVPATFSLPKTTTSQHQPAPPPVLLFPSHLLDGPSSVSLLSASHLCLHNVDASNNIPPFSLSHWAEILLPTHQLIQPSSGGVKGQYSMYLSSPLGTSSWPETQIVKNQFDC